MDWFGAVLQVIGRWRIAGYNEDCFLWSIMGRLIWMVHYWPSAYPVVILAGLSVLLEGRAWLIWRHRKHLLGAKVEASPFDKAKRSS